MKKLLLMFVMTLVGLVAFAQDPIVSITTVVANQKSGVSSYTASWILGAPESSETWTVENFNNNNSNESWNCMRCGRKSNTSVATITTDFAISASVNKVVVNMIPFIKTIDKDKLTALKLEISSTNDFTAPETTIAAENYMTATQKTEEDVTFTIPEPAANKYYRLVFECASTAANNGFVQVNSISYYGDADPTAGPAAPVVKMGANNTVEISAADGAQIYYTTNGDDPTAETGTLYTGAFTISNATVVKAIAVVDGKSSSVATFNAYLNTLSSLEELIDLGDLTHSLTVQAPMTIVYHNGRYMYVAQDNIFLLLYGVSSDDTYTNGAQLDAVTGSYTLYKDVIPEMTNVTLGNVTEGGTPVDPTAITIAEVNSYGTALMNYFVKLEGVAINLTNTKLTQDGNELTYYNQFGLTLPEATDGKTYNVEGFMSYHNGNIQLNIINVTEVEEPETPGVEYTAPSGTSYADNYLTAITSTGAQENISYTADSHPGIYSVLEAPIVATPGSEFSIEFVAKSLGEGSTSTVREDMRFNAAYIFADWYGNGEFTFIEKYGKTAPDHNIYGNYDYVMDINQAFTMPEDVNAGTAARIRIIYQNAWKGCGGDATSTTPDPNASNLDKGIAYDIVVNAVAPAPTTYAITIAETENGSIKVMNGEEEITSGTEVEEGTTLTIEATPAENYSLEAITLNDAALAAGEDGSYSFIVDEAYTVAATFAINKYAVTITEPQNGTLVVMNGEEAVATGTELAHGTELTIIATPAEGYELGAITVNDNAIEGNTLTLTEAATIAATFNEAKAPAFEYTAPSGTSYADNYLTAITSTGAQENISYTADSHPGIYSVLEAPIVATPGSEFSIEFVAKSLGEGSTSTVREDMRFNAAYIFADWYGNGEFTFIEKYGKTAPDHNIYGNYDYVMDINQAFTMPEDVNAGTAARIRIIYQNAWKGCGGDATSTTPDPNASNLDKGIAYDIVVNAVEAPVPTYAVTIAETEATVEANVEDLTAVEEGTEVTFTITAPEGKQIASVTYNDETISANEDGTYTITVNADGTLSVTLEDIPQPGKALLVPSANGRNIYTFRIDDAVLGSHTNGSCDANDLRSHNFTYSAWINIKNTTSGPIMGNIQSQFIDATGAFVVSLKDGKLNLSGRGNTSDSGYANEQPSATETTDPGTANDEWVFVSVVADREAKTVTLYKNCKAISHYDVTNKIGLLPDKSSFFIGGNGTSVEFTEVQLWNKALTPDELMDSYNLKFTETPENLAAYYKPAELVEGSTTDLRNLGTVATDVPGQLLMGTSSYDSSQWTYVYNGTPQDIELIDEDRVLGTAAITLVQPTTEGNSFKVTDAKGKEIAAEVTLFEKLNVVPALAEGVEVLGVIVEADGVKTTYTLDQFPIRATGDMTISLRLNDLFKVIATAENGTVTISVNDGEATAVAAEGTEVANGSKVVLTFTGNEGAVFKSLTVNGEDAQLTDGTYTIDAIDADYTLAAIYDLFTYKLTIINPSDDPTPENNVYGEFVDNQMNRLEYEDADGLDVTPGATVYLLISFAENHGVADSYYEFTKLTDNGVEVPRTNLFPGGENCYIYPMSNIQADHTFVIDQQLYDGIIGVGVDAEGMISFADYTIRVAADNAQIDIFDLNGRTLRSVAANEITVSDLVKGVYFAKATVNGKAYTFKFIKL